MSSFNWLKNLFTKKEKKNESGIQTSKSIEKKGSMKKKPDDLVIESIAAQFFFLQGSGSGKYDCLDTYGLYDKQSETFSFYAVFDGHGTSGKEASNSACDFMLSFISRHAEKIAESEDDETIMKLLHNMFMKADESLQTVGVDMDFSGTTCVCVLAKGTTLYVANAGDSRAVLGRITPQNRFAVELTQDHRPHVKSERDRILKQGGLIRKISNTEGPVGPYRIWADEDGPGLGLTRCLGNFSGKKIGIISAPLVQKINLKEADQFVVIATDGLWDVMTSTEVVSFILRLGEDRAQAAKLLVVEARNIWYELNRIKKTEAKISDTPEIRYGIDDISAIIIFFSYEGVQFNLSPRIQNPKINATSKTSTFNIRVDKGSDDEKSPGPELMNRQVTGMEAVDQGADMLLGEQSERDPATTNWELNAPNPAGQGLSNRLNDNLHPKDQAKVELSKPLTNMISPESLQVHMKEKKTTEGTPSNQAKQDSTLPKNTGHERLIKNEYEYDFNVEDDDDFLPDAVKNFQEEHNLTEFRGLTKTKTYGNQDGTYGANSRPGKATNPKTKDVKIKEQNSLDLLGDI